MVLKKLLEYRVTVCRMNGIQETGILVDCNEQWLKLSKDNESTLYIPLHVIRIVKVPHQSDWASPSMGSTALPQDADALLAELLAFSIEIKSGSIQHEFTDVGVLEEYDRNWIRLHKDNGQLLCLPIINVRNVRQVTPSA